MDVDPDVEGALVPSLLLQPVVENAVRHGIARRSGATGLTISARRAQGELELRVVDDGPGFDDEAWGDAGRGMGIKNTRSRLAQMYGERQSLTMERLSPHGAVVTIRVPLRVSDSTGEEKRP
jgi:LytS/YehU family sensor histidine kinase